MELATYSETILLSKLKEQIRDLQLSEEELEDKNLVRWLRARKSSLEATELMIRKHKQWCEKEDHEHILDFKVPSEWAEEFPWHVCGFDGVNGSPILVAKLGKWDVAKVAKDHKADLIRYAIQLIERTWALCKYQSKGRPYMTQFSAIYDLKGLTLRQATSYDVLEVVAAVCQAFEANWPETLNKGFVVNAPWTFQLLWKVIRPFLDERTKAKIVMLGTDFTAWKEGISKCLPIDQFPLEYGGTQDNSFRMHIHNDGSCYKVHSLSPKG